jgi:hypothetical protein
MSRPEESPADCHCLLQVLKVPREALAALLARLYFDVFQICISHGDQALASAFAEVI